MTTEGTVERKRFFVGCNWKCGLQTKAAVDEIIQNVNNAWDHVSFADVELCIFPPYVFLDRVRRQLDARLEVGSQNIGEAVTPIAPTTGTVVPEMLSSVGCRWVLLGHADRRHNLGETNGLIAAKVNACLSAGLSVNLTVGDTLADREAGNTDFELLRQLAEAVVDVPQDTWDCIVIAYEPVWAVGAGAEPCSPSEAQRVLAVLRAWIRDKVSARAASACRLVYTGSVNEENANDYAVLPDNDGFVVGRAGLNASKLIRVCAALTNLQPSHSSSCSSTCICT
jgi:triosephosphate isomerase